MTQPPLPRSPRTTTNAESDATLLVSLVDELRDRTELLEEIRRGALTADDDTRLTLALLGAMSFAHRAGCRAPLIRLFVVRVVREALAGEGDVLLQRRVTRRAVGLLDAIYLLRGPMGLDAEPQAVLSELRRVLQWGSAG